MGVADNKTYKDQYHFNDNFFKTGGNEYPSINDEPKINSTIKENPYMSNVEIEGKETVLQPDLSALFKAVGKRHSKGGMDVLLKPNSFIFSDDKSLAFTEDELELFELKKGGKFDKSNTPSGVLKKNVDVEHYNRLVNNLDSVHKDDLAKKSSMKMLEKYIGMLGNIAYVQEDKKGFPDGLPSFSLGTAPVFDKELKNEMMENKQYAKYGGNVRNPYMAEGGSFSKCPCGEDNKGKCLPCTPEQLQQLSLQARTGKIDETRGMSKIGSLDQYTDIFHTGTDPSRSRVKPGMTDQQWKDYLKNESPERRARRLASYNNTPGSDKLMKVRNFPMATIPQGNQLDLGPRPTAPNRLPQFNMQEDPDNPPLPDEVTGEGQQPIDPNWKYTPDQKISQLYSWLNFANVRRYMPYRSHFRPEYSDPTLLNEMQAVSNARANMRTQLSANKSFNPIIASAQNNAVSGQYLDKVPEIGLAVQNQNVGIRNQFAQYNNQIRNNAQMANLNFDQQYYREAIEGRKNFDNMKTFAANQAMNLRDQHTMQNQQLAYNMLTVNNPAYIFDWKTGRFAPNPNRSIHQQGAAPQDSFERMLQYATGLRDSGLDPIVQSAILRGQYFKNAAPYFQQSRTPPPFKRGGKVKNPYQ